MRIITTLLKMKIKIIRWENIPFDSAVHLRFADNEVKYGISIRPFLIVEPRRVSESANHK